MSGDIFPDALFSPGHATALVNITRYNSHVRVLVIRFIPLSLRYPAAHFNSMIPAVITGFHCGGSRVTACCGPVNRLPGPGRRGPQATERRSSGDSVYHRATHRQTALYLPL